jgi:thymidylate kinase
MTSLQAMTRQAPAKTAPTLGVLRALFDRLHADGIRYCHWKSNEHVAASLVGDTDVDVLVDRRAIAALTHILLELNFKRFVVKPGLGYPGIEDYVGFDPATGVLTHVHVHYQLTLGEKFLKGHRLPWEELYLTTRVMEESQGLYHADPHLELVVLVLRAAMKLRARDFLIQAVGKPYFRGGLVREFRWLAMRVRPERVAELAAQLVGPRAGALFPGILAGGKPTLRQLMAVRRLARPSLREYRLYGGGEAMRHAWARELGLVWWKIRNWYLAAPTRSTRTLPQGGVLVAFLGADGAGKSTVLGEIASWLSREVAVVSTYGGNGKGSANWPRRLMESLGAVRRRVVKAVRRRNPGAGGATTATSASGPASISPVRAVWVLALARERCDRALEARRAKGRGLVVLSDRLSQSQFPGWNDGPRLHAWTEHHARWRREAARRERESFELAELCAPDLVLKLHITPELASRRKPETPREQVRTGVDLLRRLSYPSTTRVVDIDASRPLPEVLLQAKQAVWDAL